MARDDRHARGVGVFEEVMGFAPPALEGDVFLDAITDHLVAEVWSRPGLSLRDRRLQEVVRTGRARASARWVRCVSSPTATPWGHAPRQGRSAHSRQAAAPTPSPA
jgi:hypothetical protein